MPGQIGLQEQQTVLWQKHSTGEVCSPIRLECLGKRGQFLLIFYSDPQCATRFLAVTGE